MSSSLEGIITLLGDITESDLTTWIDELKYHGVDLEYICSHIASKIKNDQSRVPDLKFCILAGLVRGNMYQKIAKSMPPEQGRKLREACSHFDIVEQVSKSPNKARAITLARLRTAIPQFAAQLLFSSKVVRPVTILTLNQTFGGEFPLVLRDLCIASLVPQDEYNGFTKQILDMVITCIKGYCFLESRVIGDRKKSDMENLSMITTYINAARTSPHITPAMRKIFAAKYLGFALKPEFEEFAIKVQNYLSTYESLY